MSLPLSTIARAWTRGTNVSQVEKQALELEVLAESIIKKSSVRRFLAHPKKTIAQKAALLKEAGFSEPVCSMMVWLIKGRRLNDLPQLVRQVQRLAITSGGPLTARVTSVLPLTTVEQNELLVRLTKLAGRAVKIQQTVDRSILGGLIINLSGQRRDLSLISRIQGLRRAVATSV